MEKVILEFTDDDARSVAYFLRRRYGKDKRTGLARLCRIAALQEVAAQAQEELTKDGYQVKR